MRRKTKATFVANVESILRPYKGRRNLNSAPDPEDRQVHLTPHDLASIVINGLEARGFKITVPKATMGDLA